VADLLEGLLSGRVESKHTPEVDALFIEVDKVRKQMKANAKSVCDYTLIE
jgi:hypothetical protein